MGSPVGVLSPLCPETSRKRGDNNILYLHPFYNFQGALQGDSPSWFGLDSHACSSPFTLVKDFKLIADYLDMPTINHCHCHLRSFPKDPNGFWQLSRICWTIKLYLYTCALCSFICSANECFWTSIKCQVLSRCWRCREEEHTVLAAEAIDAPPIGCPWSPADSSCPGQMFLASQCLRVFSGHGMLGLCTGESLSPRGEEVSG